MEPAVPVRRRLEHVLFVQTRQVFQPIILLENGVIKIKVCNVTQEFFMIQAR
jgi:hypothetical protein